MMYMFRCLWLMLGIVTFVVPEAGAQVITEEERQQLRDSSAGNPQFLYRKLHEFTRRKGITTTELGSVYANLASYFNKVGVPDSALFYAQKALDRLEKGRPQLLAYRLMGSGLVRKGEPDTALSWLLKGLKLAEQQQDRLILCILKTDLGNLYHQKEEYEKAITYLEESVALADTPALVDQINVNIGNIYKSMGNLKKAEAYYTKSLAAPSAVGNPYLLATISSNLGSIALERKRYKEALDHFHQVRSVAEQHNFVALSISSIHNLGVIERLNGNLASSITLLNEALVMAKDVSSMEQQKSIYDDLIATYTEAKEYEKANALLKSYYQLRDSINKNKFDKEIKELEVSYETSRKEKEIDFLKTSSERQKSAYQKLRLEKELEDERNKNRILSLENSTQKSQNENLKLKEIQTKKENELQKQKLLKRVYVIGALILLVPIIVMMVFYYQKLRTQLALNRYQEKVNEQKMTGLIRDQEIQLIKSAAEVENKERERIAQELHDSIGGNLAYIKLKLSYLAEDKAEYTSLIAQLNETCDQVRNLSHDLVAEKIESGTFTSVVKGYAKNVAMASDIPVRFYPFPEEGVNRIDDRMQVALFKVIQELLNNAVKHSQAETIDIHLNRHGDEVKLLFEDNGIGFDVNEITDGIGLRNIRNRVGTLSGTVDIDSYIGRGTVINIDIPITDS